MPNDQPSAPLTPELPPSESCRLGGGIPDRSPNRLPWVKASGTPETHSRKAAQYLRVFDLEQAALFDVDTMILAKVVCNLRNYYQQDADQTVELMTKLFNPRSWVVWSPEGIRLTWDRVECFTPSLGLSDEITVARRRAAELEDDVLDLIAYTRSGGRVSTEDLRDLFAERNPDLQFTPVAFGIAVNAVTGMTSRASHGTRYWVGFHLPTSAELAEHEPKAA